VEPPDYLPLSILNQIEYCERRFWLMFVHGEMVISALFRILHKQVSISFNQEETMSNKRTEKAINLSPTLKLLTMAETAADSVTKFSQIQTELQGLEGHRP